MAEHLEYHHGKSFTEFTLYHNPTQGGLKDTWESLMDKVHRSTDVTLQFTSIIKQVQEGKHTVNWLAHSQGAIIFCEATRVLIKQGITNLDKNKVVFDGGANNKSRSDPLMRRVGIEFKHNSAPNDLVHHIAGGNAASIKNIIASAVHLPRVIFGTTESSAHTLSYKGHKQRALSLKYGTRKPGLLKQGINTFAVKFWDT